MSENKRKPVKPVTSLQLAADLGKLPPQAVDLEELVLGAILIVKDCYPNVSCIITENDFYKEAHQKIFSAITGLFNTACPVDIATVTQELKRRGELEFVGGPYYISQLTNRLASSANVEYHAFIVKQKSIQRNLIRICTDAVRDAYEDTTDVLELVDKVQGAIDGVGISDVSSGAIDARTRIYNTLAKVEAGRNHNGVTGVPCGIVSVDRFTGGFQPGDLIFIGARPGNFKTGLIMSFAHKMIPLGFTPFIAQQEMGESQSGMRELAMYSGVDTQNIRRGVVTDAELEELRKAADEIAKLNVFIDHTGGMSISRIKAKVRKQTKIKKIDILFIDYLQLLELETGSKNATDESLISKTTRKLKLMAKELDIPVVVLSQLNREVEGKKDKRPEMQHLKGSGAIEADADVVILLYNPGKYFADPVDDITGESLKNRVELIFVKNRQGDTKSVWLNVNPGTNIFDDEIKPVTPHHNLNSDTLFSKEKITEVQGDLPF